MKALLPVLPCLTSSTHPTHWSCTCVVAAGETMLLLVDSSAAWLQRHPLPAPACVWRWAAAPPGLHEAGFCGRDGTRALSLAAGLPAICAARLREGAALLGPLCVAAGDACISRSVEPHCISRTAQWLGLEPRLCLFPQASSTWAAVGSYLSCPLSATPKGPAAGLAWR